MLNTSDILIIGAGPAGMAAAMELSKAGRGFTVVEKSNQVGGLAKTYTIREGDLEFVTDNGPHRFFSKNKYLYDFIEDLLQEKWILVKRQNQQYINGKFYDYPINPKQTLRNLGFMKAVRIIFDYTFAQIQYRFFKKRINNFADRAIADFGRTLAEFNVINYTEKVWGIPAHLVHSDWAKQRIRGLNLFSLVTDAIRRTILSKTEHDPNKIDDAFVDAFYFPDQGSGLIYEAIKKKIVELGNPVFLNSYPTKIMHDGSKITECIMNLNGQEKKFSPDYLVESVPITEFMKLLSPSPPQDIMDAAEKLQWRAQIYLFITLDKERVTPNQWIYFPDKNIPFGRISEMKNFSEKMSPKGKTSIFVEFFCFEGDQMWNLPNDKLFDLAAHQLESMGFFKRQEVRSYYVFKQSGAYPVYDLGYEPYLAKLKNYLDQFKNLYYIGRPGRFRYNNQDHSLEMGILAARSIIDGRRYDVENVEREKEYFEKGYVKIKR